MDDHTKYTAIVFGISTLLAVRVYFAYRKAEVSENLKYRTFWPRFWSAHIDGLVLMPITIVISSIYRNSNFLTLSIVFWLLGAFVSYYYSIYMHGKYGQTIGKMICKVKVVSNSNEREINYTQSFFRDSAIILLSAIMIVLQINILFKNNLPFSELIHPSKENISLFINLSILPFVWFAFEVITMFTNKKRRAVHDYIAQTVVVRTNIKGMV